ncbi:hypothetical protein BO94DRAFT_537422 [Aspergillus sclerotioniger CBS 115572]|uniref:Uncharacterized protein n=1 Tax=Aspergillus sclerotioniger CBS 115572 TaxID=1450535 RepID=A0A317W2A2_9EURO|nr:hypothetical protein BO94DRAFT_537422 [Aspergillus sclerotioniger CBS 115572]PWY79402.1 hypothetical protein BO94DRAFT_537422 [Aspergillus sclerotioniger CBS 115572]
MRSVPTSLAPWLRPSPLLSSTWRACIVVLRLKVNHHAFTHRSWASGTCASGSYHIPVKSWTAVTDNNNFGIILGLSLPYLRLLLF